MSGDAVGSIAGSAGDRGADRGRKPTVTGSADAGGQPCQDPGVDDPVELLRRALGDLSDVLDSVTEAS